jgi:2-C-methyl-D-erythritol 4-phosphate cytidylyltransferase
MPIEKQRKIAIILASGTGARFRSDTPKQFMKVAGKTVLEHTLDVFELCSSIDEIIVVVASETRLFTEEIISSAGYRKVTKIVNGGHTRQLSSSAGINSVVGDHHKVLVHDAVRPLVDHAVINRCLDALDDCDAADTAIPSSDTIIHVAENNTISDIPDRSTLQLGQTPQGFRAGILRRAHQLASSDDNFKITDDCGLVIRYNLSKVKVVAGSVNNIKITYSSDIYLADRLFQLRANQAVDSPIGRRLDNKVVLVFGGSRGIGQSIVNMAEARGAKVLSASRSNGVDVADPEAVRKFLRNAFSEYGRLDFVINTAGILHTGLLSGMDYRAIDQQISTNLRGSFVVAREAFEMMQKSGGSISLFTSSSYTRGRARYSVYSATKAAVVNLVQALAQEFLPFGVRINAINPERTATPMRTENFGNESASELLNADTVALATLAVALSDASGEVVDVRKQT